MNGEDDSVYKKDAHGSNEKNSQPIVRLLLYMSVTDSTGYLRLKSTFCIVVENE